MTRSTWSQLTFDGSSELSAWAPDGRSIAFGSSREGAAKIYVKQLGEAGERRLETGSATTFPLSWSADGRYLALVTVSADTVNDIAVYDLKDERLLPFVASPFREGAPAFSPDGKWIAYTSDKSGTPEIYMRPFPGPGEEWTISVNGGNEPIWAANSGELFFRQGDAVMAVDVKTTPTLLVGTPRRLFAGPYERSTASWPNYAVSADGRRFLMVKGPSLAPETRINVILNWTGELQRLAPKP